MPVDVVRLSGPKEEDGEEIGTANESDDESKGEDARRLLHARGEHGILGKFPFPDHKGDQKEETDEEGGEDVGRAP